MAWRKSRVHVRTDVLRTPPAEARAGPDGGFCRGRGEPVDTLSAERGGKKRLRRQPVGRMGRVGGCVAGLGGGLDARLAKFGAITEPERLTDGARYADHPKVSPDGSALIYIRSDGRSDTRLVSASPSGGGESTIARIRARRFTFAPNGEIVVDQLEFSGRYRRFRDLYRVTPDGAAHRLTTGARLSAPSAGPGNRAVAVAEGEGTNGIVRVNINTGAIDTLVHPEDGVYWALPAVSPDGRRIAATRWADGNQDIVVLDERGGPRQPGHPGPRAGLRTRVEPRRAVAGVGVRPDRHSEHPRGAFRRCEGRGAGHAHERPYGRRHAERGPVGEVALYLRVPRGRMGGRTHSVRSGPRPPGA